MCHAVSVIKAEGLTVIKSDSVMWFLGASHFNAEIMNIDTSEFTATLSANPDACQYLLSDECVNGSMC